MHKRGIISLGPFCAWQKNLTQPPATMKKLYFYICVSLLSLFLYQYSYSYPDEAQYPLLGAEHVSAPEHEGMTFQFEGAVIDVFTTKEQLIIVKLKSAAQNVVIDVPIFPSMGTLPQQPQVGDLMKVIGNLGSYKGKPQLKPLTTALITISSLNDAAQDRQEAYSIRQAISEATDAGTVLVGPITTLNTSPFISKSKKEHLRLVITDASGMAEGIMWAGNWNEQMRRTMDQGQPFYASAEVGTFRGQPSFNLNRITFVEAQD